MSSQNRSRAAIVKRPLTMLREFMQFEAAGGVVLLLAALAALITANSGLGKSYFALLETYLGPLSVLHWINDGLMVLFFLLVGLEIKHELTQGELATSRQRILPGFAALAGMVVPALVYLIINRHDEALFKGWAIPSATDIAFALGILSLLGDRVPSSLKIFLTALAIIDDLGAVLIIALFFGGPPSWGYLAGAALVVAILILMNRANVRTLPLYLGAGLLLWFLVLRSGVHATLAGVILAFTIPLSVPTPDEEPDDSPLHRLENKLDRLVPFVIVPLFGFANAGVSFQGVTLSVLTDSLTLGIGFGLFLGKALGICGVTFLLVKLGFAQLPHGSTWPQFTGVSFLCGVGFTMSLFISMLAFAGDPFLQEESKVGILLGSLCSGVVGAIWLLAAGQRSANETEAEEEAEVEDE